jgi:hypothetical protein
MSPARSPTGVLATASLSTRLCSSIASKMATTTIPPLDIQCELALPLRAGWRNALERMRRSRVQPGGRVRTECFGRLTAKDEMVVKGLVASFAGSSAREPDRC